MEEQTDKVFIRNFSLIVVALTVFTISIIILARVVGAKAVEDIPSRSALTEQRISPVAGASTSTENAAAAEAAPVASAPVPAAAFDGSLDGEMIYGSVCSACHAAAVLGAPQPGSAEMALRAEKGMDALMQSALNGFNAMPARGGRPDLSDEQVKAVIEFMLK